jgi:hypothetical protein
MNLLPDGVIYQVCLQTAHVASDPVAVLDLV